MTTSIWFWVKGQVFLVTLIWRRAELYIDFKEAWISSHQHQVIYTICANEIFTCIPQCNVNYQFLMKNAEARRTQGGVYRWRPSAPTPPSLAAPKRLPHHDKGFMFWKNLKYSACKTVHNIKQAISAVLFSGNILLESGSSKNSGNSGLTLTSTDIFKQEHHEKTTEKL